MKHFKWLIFATIANLAITLNTAYLLEKYKPELLNSEGFSDKVAKITKQEVVNWYFPIVILIAASTEEFFFRFLPFVAGITICMIFFSRKGKNYYIQMTERKRRVIMFTLLMIAVPVSIVFGLIHGNYVNILIQGVSGLIFSILGIIIINDYFKEEDYHDYRDSSVLRGALIGSIASSLSHALFNLTILYFWAFS